jgi:hypothetical protein
MVKLKSAFFFRQTEKHAAQNAQHKPQLQARFSVDNYQDYKQESWALGNILVLFASVPGTSLAVLVVNFPVES